MDGSSSFGVFSGRQASFRLLNVLFMLLCLLTNFIGPLAGPACLPAFRICLSGFSVGFVSTVHRGGRRDEGQVRVYWRLIFRDAPAFSFACNLLLLCIYCWSGQGTLFGGLGVVVPIPYHACCKVIEVRSLVVELRTAVTKLLGA